MKAIDFLAKANAGKEIEEKFVIPGMESYGEVKLTAASNIDIAKEQTRFTPLEYSKCKDKGMNKMTIDEEGWKEWLADMDEEERNINAQNRPRNLADQVAKRCAVFDAILVVITKNLKNLDGELLFPDYSEQQKAQEIIAANSILTKFLVGKYNIVQGKLNEIVELAKNSPKRGRSKSSDSKTLSQDDIQDMESRSTKS